MKSLCKNHLNQSRNEKLNKISFRYKVIGNLRDRGIVIASGKQGYKLPSTCNSIYIAIAYLELT
jgi:hypothetical protein